MSLSAPVAGLEIGTTRTVVAIGEPRNDGNLEITAVGAIPSTGVRKSQIIEMTQARYSIESVLKRLEEQFGYTIGHACLAVSGPHVRTTAMNTQWQLERGFVHDDDIAEITARAEETNLPPERTQLELHPISYSLDDISSIASPKGMNGNLLKLRSLCIHGSTQRINDARSAANAAKLEITAPCFAGTCAANAVLTMRDKREGALVIDLGGGSTSYTAWEDGQLSAAGVLGVGGDHVTNDIHTAFSISVKQADELKTSVASAVISEEDGGQRVPVPSPMPGFKAASISRRALNTVVNARMQELFTIIRTKLDEENLLHRLSAGVVLTGGGAALPKVAVLANSTFGCGVRIGTIIPEIQGVEKVAPTVPPAALATIAGLLLRAAADESHPSFLDSFTGMFKGFFSK